MRLCRTEWVLFQRDYDLIQCSNWPGDGLPRKSGSMNRSISPVWWPDTYEHLPMHRTRLLNLMHFGVA